MSKLQKILFLLTADERKQIGLLLVMVTITALLDMIGVASILPFMAVLTNPDLVNTNFLLNTLFQSSSILGVEDNEQFLFLLGVFVLILLIFSLSFKALTSYVQVRFVRMREYTIGKRLLEGYLHQPYSWFLNRNSADLGKIILSEVNVVIDNALNPLMELVAKGMIVIALITLLILVDPKLALIVGFFLGAAYGLIFYSIRNYISRIGQERLKNNQLRFLTISEAFGAAKEIKLGGLEKIFIDKFSKSGKILARTIASSQVIAILPRFILEAIAFGGILLIMLYIMTQTGNFNNAIPIVSLYVFAGYRLMPAIQQIYNAFTQLSFVGSSLNKLYNDLNNLKPIVQNSNKNILPFDKTITLKNIQYNYPNTLKSTLRDISLSISSRSIVGIVGATGSGKTTVVDIILGLLEPQNGKLEIDGKIITKSNIRSWQRSIGYVPQQIFLTDNTIASNIAFGLEIEDINQEAIEKASKIANLHEFIVKELPEKYQTIVGERGIRLSGGQRQRIGIARALYHNPKLLILDEATSALDNQTEKAVMDAINNLGKDITIILIAHRLGTIKKCDKIFLLKDGEVIEQGSFEELVNSNEDFRKSAML